MFAVLHQAATFKDSFASSARSLLNNDKYLNFQGSFEGVLQDLTLGELC